MSAMEATATRAVPDRDSEQWVAQLRVGHPRHDQAVVRLHGVLGRVALSELWRRRRQLGEIGELSSPPLTLAVFRLAVIHS